MFGGRATAAPVGGRAGESETLCRPPRRLSGMRDSVPAPVGVLVRGLVAACFVGGGVLALLGRRFALAGLAYLAGYTALAAAAVARGQRRRGAGLSLSGLGWLALALGVAAGYAAGPGLALVAAGLALLVVGTVVVVWPFGGGADRDAAETRE